MMSRKILPIGLLIVAALSPLTAWAQAAPVLKSVSVDLPAGDREFPGGAAARGRHDSGRTRSNDVGGYKVLVGRRGAGSVSDLGVLARLGAIGAVILCVAGAFAYVGGWLSPGRLTQDRMMTAFQDANG